MAKLREIKDTDVRDIYLTRVCLEQAREIAKRIGTPFLLKKIRSALKSAEGAERHIHRIKNEKERQQNVDTQAAAAASHREEGSGAAEAEVQGPGNRSGQDLDEEVRPGAREESERAPQ